MSWNYRIIKDGDNYAVCEVFYEKGVPHRWSEPITLEGESTDDILEQLEMILKDINNTVIKVENDKITYE